MASNRFVAAITKTNPGRARPPVHLLQQLRECLGLQCVSGVTAAGHREGVDLIDEEDRGRVRPRGLEALRDAACRLAQVLALQFGGGASDEAHARLVGKSTGDLRAISVALPELASRCNPSRADWHGAWFALQLLAFILESAKDEKGDQS